MPTELEAWPKGHTARDWGGTSFKVCHKHTRQLLYEASLDVQVSTSSGRLLGSLSSSASRALALSTSSRLPNSLLLQIPV